jgi:hypothetical protein
MLLSDIVLGRSTGRGGVYLYPAVSSPSLCDHGGVVLFTSPGRFAWEEFDNVKKDFSGRMSPGLGCYPWAVLGEGLRQVWGRSSLSLADVCICHHCSLQICDHCGDIFSVELVLVIELLPMSRSHLSTRARMGH